MEDQYQDEKLQFTNFKNQMNAMRAHYKSGARTSYILSSNSLLLAVDEELPEEAVNEVNEFGTFTDSFNDEQQTGLTESAEKYKMTNDYKSFKEQMEEKRNEAKKTADARIDDYYDKMIDIGEKHPKSQNAILVAVDQVSNFFNGLLQSISDFCVKIANEIVKYVEKVFGKIKSFFSDTGKKIKKFFHFKFLSPNVSVNIN